ncbi:MAG: arylamine N-acetyltransferase [Proteobacteria bacterium]|nr:arylamine N-acetyltransferase [Pseudomonadota bacterium]
MKGNLKETAPTLDVIGYLDRIGYRAQVWPNLVTLRGLHLSHLFTVPFENLDIYLGRDITLDETSWFQKIVQGRRGGFCYELNGLFAALLKALGFSVTVLSARVRTPDGKCNPEFDHMVLLVHLAKRWLVDVGFGESFREPLCLDMEGEQVQSNGTYRLTSDDAVWQYQTQQQDGSWQPVYCFTLAPRHLDDFAGMCRFHQTSPKSPFTQGALCSLATTNGRMTLTDKLLTVIDDDTRNEEQVPDEATWRSLLSQHFHIRL